MPSRNPALSLPATLLLSLAACGALACGSAPKPADAPPSPSPPDTSATTPPAADAGAMATPATPAKGQAHALLVLVASCWYGGVWSEGEGADTPETRKATSEARCHDATKRAFGTDDKEKYEQLRAYEANAVEDLGKKIGELAKADAVDAPRKDTLAKFVTVLAAAKKEEMLARRAGDRVKRDLAKEPEKLTADEVAAVGPLKQTTALEQLLKLDAGDLTTEAHTFAVLSGMERMAIARGLPRHLKIYSVSGAFKLLFNVDAPAVPEDLTKPLKPGTWLAYLVTAAKGAGHAVPDTAKTPLEKEPMGWAGVLEGLHDQLGADGAKLSDETNLKSVVASIAKRLEHEYNDERNALRSKAAPTAPAPSSATPASTKK
jgi:hypothetical protein